MLAYFVQLPDDVKVSIAALFVAVFALAFDFMIGRFAWLAFLRKYQEEWALGLSAAFVQWLENVLPTGFEDVSIKGVSFLVAGVFVVIYLLTRKALKKNGFKAFQ